MKNAVIQEEAVKTYSNRLLQRKNSTMDQADGSECILFCKRVTPNIFNIKNGFAIMTGTEECFNDGVCMISNFTKVVFVFDNA